MKRVRTFLLLSGIIILALAGCRPGDGQIGSDMPGAVGPTGTAPATAAANPTPTPTTQNGDGLTLVEHKGISFSYDPAVLEDVNIQDVPATADQGFFGQPSPAHTWFGFVPEGIVRDLGNHWGLLREPQLIFFSLNDFGSFAPADEQARQKIGAFKQLLAERPSAFSGEVPILPPINAAQTIQAQVRWLSFDGGTGVRFLTSHTQEVAPIANDRLVYIFYGLTDDGQHGVTAVFPIEAASLPDTPPPLSEDEITYLNEHYEEAMAAVSQEIDGLGEGDFSPLLSELDDLVQSIRISPGENEFPVTAVGPQNARVLVETEILDGPGGKAIGSLAAGEAVVVNGASEDGQFNRILCGDGTTGSCWLPAGAVEMVEVDPVPGVSDGGPVEGQVVQIQALVENVVFAAPDESAAMLGSLQVDEVAEVFAADESGAWLNIACPRYIGESCWVISDPAVNNPTAFFSSDGWRPVTSDYVSFRVPIEWEPVALNPEAGSVLAEWRLGIPGVESDQVLGFFAVPFENLKPSDVASETPFEIGGRPGVKWVRSGPGYVSYDYYTSGTGEAGSFGVHVTVSQPDSRLEETLDMLAASITFGP